MAVDIKPTKAAGLAKVGADDLKIEKALAAIEQIETDNAAIDVNIAALPAADNAAVKAMVGDLLQGLKRNNIRQRRIISFLMKQIET